MRGGPRGRGWVEGRHSLPGSGLRFGARTPAPLPSFERGDPKGPASGVFGKLGGMLAGVESQCAQEQGCCAGAAAGTKGTFLLRTAGLRVSPGG